MKSRFSTSLTTPTVRDPNAIAPLDDTSTPETPPISPLGRPDAPKTTGEDRARVRPGAELPPRVAAALDRTPLGELLDRVEAGGALAGADAAPLLFALRGKGLTRGDLVTLRKHVLSRLPQDRAHLNRSKAALDGRPGPHHILQLLLPAGEPRPEVRSLEAARGALQKLDAGLAKAVDAGDVAKIADLEGARVTQAAIVEGFEAWPTERFGDEIARFREQGAAVPPERAGPLLYGLRRLGASPAELGALRDALLERRDEASAPKSATVEPPTPESLFALMSGVEAAPTIKGLDAQLRDARAEGDPRRARDLEAAKQSLVEYPSALLEAPLAAFGSGRGIAPGYAAVLARSLDKMQLEPAQLAHLQGCLLERIPAKTRRPRAEVAADIRAADTPAALVRVFTGEVLGKPPLPLDRKALTRLISKTQGERGAATQARIRLLDGRAPDALPPDARARLDKIDRRIEGAGRRLDELKAARSGVNAVRGQRWLDRLEVDVLAGGAVGIPGVFSGSAMAGVSVNEADATTGAREKGVAGYVMPAFSVGGYGKLDVSYDRTEGVGVSGGGGADFLGIWGGPGGKSWGNIFAGGIWVPQVINVGAGYGVEDGEPYGALILSTFWPPFSAAAGRVDTVVRHPGLALGAERGAELVRKLSESPVVQGGKTAISTAAGWIGDAMRPLVTPVKRGAQSLLQDRKIRRAAEGLEGEADLEAFSRGMRALLGPSEAARTEAGDDEAPLQALHRDEVKAILPELQALAEANPTHVPTFGLLAAASTVTGDAEGAVAAAAQGIDAARSHDDPEVLRSARDNFVETALLHDAYEAAWPELAAALKDGPVLKPRLQLVRWLAGQGRAQEAKQVAEGLLHEHPRSFAAQNALSGVTNAPAEAQVQT